MPTKTQMKTTRMPNWANMKQDLFTLHRVPGNDSAFMLGSKKWPGYAVAMRQTEGTALSAMGMYEVKLSTRIAPWNPSTVMLQVCSLKKKTGQPHVKIGSLGRHGIPVWAYVHHGSWLVYGSLSDPGEGGHWIPEPPFEEGALPDCE